MIKVYSMKTCPYCDELKGLLKEQNVEFTDVDINLQENEAEYLKISEIAKSNDVPIVRVGKQLLVPNISFKSIKEAVSLTKKFIG